MAEQHTTVAAAALPLDRSVVVIGAGTMGSKGVNYPAGPMEWGRGIGFATVLGTLRNLGVSYGEDRYRASVWLQREVQLASCVH